jgi:ribosome-associated toxin RatA of RatAB toxin-antitoxin module
MADQTTSSTVINASPEEIMAVIADLERYPEWSAGVKSVEVLTVYDDEDERPAKAHFAIDMSGIKDDYTLDYDWHGNESVTWTLDEGHVIKAMDGEYALRDNGDGSTTVDYTLAVDVSIPMLGMMKRRAEKVIIDTALKGLKKRVEG